VSKFIVFFDLETGGLADDAPIVQLAGVALDEESWREVASFEAKVQFDEARADLEALIINHYDSEAWKREAVPPSEACRRFATFVKPYCSIEMISKRTMAPYRVAKLAGHNAVAFDGPRIKAMFAACSAFLPCSYHIRDTLQRAMWWFDERPEAPRPKDLKLGTLAEYFGIPVYGAHDALADVRTTAAIAKAMRDGARVAANA
jgi:DNA polymerase III alpha subunit (gram-positive type)